MDSKYTNTNKNYWHTFLNDKLIGLDIKSAIEILHKYKFSYFYRNHDNDKVFAFDQSEIGKKFESMCTIDTVTNNNLTVISFIKVPPESTVFRKFPI